MLKKHLIATAFALFSTSVAAAPELMSPVEIEFGQYAHIETIEIVGNINASLLRLVDDSLQSNDSDYYVISDISENAQQNTMTISVDLYNNMNTTSDIVAMN
ncbi:hypothetical protein [Photobacterium sanguinicancri]|uniref:Uncharacterized protein n=1 Tax=Photobacterium sanguinicancri TaxID=875932 RepID=A0AAW7Y747_9GAMM|nr:hypothetical protein [Photobacterium sanguinicancri]KXI23420.1 hypothetical protein AS132_07970 [Photobacterium sanguinicancri]MDO6542718.1 hypothetical protein [Photobacterium sanguinicancri]